MDLLTLVLYALIAFRLSEMLVIDDGLFDVFSNLRGWFNRAPFDSHGLRRSIADVLTCVHCVGVWIALVLTFTLPFTTILDFFIWFLAIAGLQSVIAGKLGRTQ